MMGGNILEKLKLVEIQDRLKKEGINISERTFEYYQRLGLLPKPGKKEVGKKGRGVYGYYDIHVIKHVRAVQKLKEKGNTLDQILGLMQKEILDKYRSTWRKFQYGSPLLETEGELHKEPPCFLEKRLLRKLPLWATTKEIEILVLKDMNREAYALKRGLRKALMLCGQEESKYPGDVKATQIISGLKGKLEEEIDKLTMVQRNAKADLTEKQEKQQMEGQKEIFIDASNSHRVASELN
jgi:DNA-binding transcriptional MerR regulator